MSEHEDTFEIGYREDGVFWLTQSVEVRDAASAERYMGGNWRVVDEVFLGPSGRMVNVRDEEWEECMPSVAGSRRGWRLVDADTPEVFYRGEWIDTRLALDSDEDVAT